MFSYTHALCRKIPHSIVADGLRMDSNHEPIDYGLAIEQHEKYVEALRNIGLQVTVLEADEKVPDCVFVEDTAIIVDETVMITNPGAESRMAETRIIKSHFEGQSKLKIVEMEDGEKLDGGDVLFTGYEIFVGLSSRTNDLGIQRIRKTFPEIPVFGITVKGALHLKSLMSMCGANKIAVGCSHDAKAALEEVLSKTTRSYDVVDIPDDYAANFVVANGHLLHRSKTEFPRSHQVIKELPLKKIDLNISEVSKVDGALTCLSLLY